MTAYDDLRRQFHVIASLQQARGFLEWDMQTVMPEGGADARGADACGTEARGVDAVAAALADIIATRATRVSPIRARTRRGTPQGYGTPRHTLTMNGWRGVRMV